MSPAVRKVLAADGSSTVPEPPSLMTLHSRVPPEGSTTQARLPVSPATIWDGASVMSTSGATTVRVTLSVAVTPSYVVLIWRVTWPAVVGVKRAVACVVSSKAPPPGPAMTDHSRVPPTHGVSRALSGRVSPRERVDATGSMSMPRVRKETWSVAVALLDV